MDISKFDIGLAKRKNFIRYPYHRKFLCYHPHSSMKDIRDTLFLEAENYCRKLHKLPDMVHCDTYWTKDAKCAVLELKTPKLRKLYKDASEMEEHFFDHTLMEDLRRKYGFIPKPSNVLAKYIAYGYMKSQDVEHLYHNQPVDWEITDDLRTFEEAYRVNYDDKDILVGGFNGYSCMSEEPYVGTFYYYFGAYLLVFYKKGTKDIVGRMVLWKWEDQLYYLKGYVLTPYQIKAAEVVDKLDKEGKITTHLPAEFTTSLQRMDKKTKFEIFDELADKIRVPYIDEDLALSGDKTTLSFSGYYDCKKTGCQTLEEYGIYYCEECGEEVDEDDVVEVGDSTYCTSCAHCCAHCDDWYAPDADGDVINGDWYCEYCRDDLFAWCEQCQKYYDKDDEVEYKDKWGGISYMCSDCAEAYCERCDECEELCDKDMLKELKDQHLCPECYEEKQKEA